MVQLLRFFATGEDQPRLTDQREIDRQYRGNRLSVMLAITLGYGIAYTCRLGLSVVKKPLIDSGLMSASDLGIIGAGLFYAYGLGKLTNGFLSDHANIKRFFAVGVLGSAFINLTMGRSDLLWVWVALWALNGWFQGFGAPSSAVALANWFSNRERGRMYGIWSTAHAFGEGLTFSGSMTLVSLFGWQAGFWGPGVICIFVAVAIYFTLQDRPETLGLPPVADWKNDHGAPATDQEGAPLDTGKAQKLIFRIPAIWILGLASATMYMTRYAINSWGILYLQEARGYADKEAGYLLGLSAIVGIMGCVAYGFISDNLFRARRPPVTLAFGIVEIASLFMIFYIPPGHPVLFTVAFVIYGFTLSGILAALGGLFAIDIVPKRAAGAVMGFIGVFSYLGAGIQDQISGILIEQGTTMVEGVLYYDFSSVVIFWIGASIVSLILAASLWRTKITD